MILHALYDYYRRKAADPDPARRLPAFGLEDKPIPFIIELSEEGKPLGIVDTRQIEAKKKVARRYLVPKGIKRAINISANLLWDTAEYTLGVDTRGNPERVVKQHAAFRQRLAQLPESARTDAGLRALEAFYAQGGAALLHADPAWPEIVESNPNITFRLFGESDLICQRPAVASAIGMASDETPGHMFCLVTGEACMAELLHASIKGIWKAQPMGASLVSFNARAYESYGKIDRQGENAPVSPAAAFAYTTALNHLLNQPRQRLQVGDASTVFWAQRGNALAEEIEAGFGDAFGEAIDDPDARTDRVRGLLGAIRNGQFGGELGQEKFYVLGLAPNAARVAVRFWQDATLAEIGQRIAEWFADLNTIRGPRDPEFPSLFRLLAACAAQGKADNIPPRLGGDILRAALSGSAFPEAWLYAAVQRCRAEQNVPYLRAAALRACLNRRLRRSGNIPPAKEFLPMLDISDPRPAYRLGRLFAALEKIQEESSPGLNATIRERYYGAESSTPVSVFTTLLRLKQHHLAKLANRGRAVNFERLIGEIMGGLSDFPRHLSLPEQGEFALGYYHQRQDFFNKTSPSPESTEGETQ